MCQYTDWASMHSKGRWVTPMVVMVAMLLVFSSGPSAGIMGDMGEKLPVPIGMTSAVYTGIVIYVFGGATNGGILDAIYAVDPESGKTTVLPYTLPSPRKLASAIWTGKAAYIIGGIGYDAEPIAEIVKFVPGEGVSVVEGAMPYGTKGIPSVWSGEAVYILGNCLSSDVGQHDVIKFDPSNGSSEIIEDVLPIPGAGSSATWAGDCAYIVGGRQNLTILSDRVIRYVPGEGAEYMEARLPQGRIGAACAWDGERVSAFGGTIALECGPLECVPIDYLDQIVEFDPVNDTCTLSGSSLLQPMDVRAAVFVHRDSGFGDGVIIPGGLTAEGPIDQISIQYSDVPPSPDPDRSLARQWIGWFADNFLLISVVSMIIFSACWVGYERFIRPERERRSREPSLDDEDALG